MPPAEKKMKDREHVARKLGSALLEALEYVSSGQGKSSLIPIEDFLNETSPRERHVAIGKRISERRRGLELSQEDAAKYIDVSQPVYSRIEAGTKILSIVKAEKLAKLLKCSPEWIITGSE